MNLVNGLNNLLKGAPSNIINTPTATAAKVIIDYNQLTKPSAAPAAAEVAPPSTTAPVASPSTEVAPAANTTQTTENGPANSSNYIIAEQGSNGAAVKLIHDALIKLQPRSIKQDAFNSSMAGQLSGYYLLTDYPANKYGDETVGAINLFQFKMNYPGPNMGKVDTQTWDLLFNEKNESKRKAAFPPPVVRTQVPLQFENATEITSPESEEE
jgi:peptidoglycan hydrolase-like protein with peptidoglycan-binding domain